MPNIVFKLGSLDLSAFVRVNPGDGLDPGSADMLEPAFSDSPFFEGQFLTSLHAKNKEMKWPLFLHPSQAPYLQDGLNQLVQGINQQLRPIVDQGQTVLSQWQNAQASNPTFYTVQFGRFEPAFNFRQTEKGWLAGILHLWVQPYGHTATQRSLGTYSAPANQGGLLIPPASLIAAGGTVVGDVSPQFEILTTVGSYLGDDGRIGIISALPQASYTPIIPVSSFVGLSPSAVVYGASGAWASQFLAIDNTGGSQGNAVQGSYNTSGYFSLAIAPASLYAGNNRILGLVRARNVPFCLRAFDPTGNPLGPTVIASAVDGWQLVDYGVLRVAPWMATALVNIQAYQGIAYSASGMVTPNAAPPPWTKEHGPIFVIPDDSSILSLDWNSPLLSADGFDSGASGALLQTGQDQLGNTWLQMGPGQFAYNGISGAVPNGVSSNYMYSVGSFVSSGDYDVEAVFRILALGQYQFGVGGVNLAASMPQGAVMVCASSNGFGYLKVGAASAGLTVASGGLYHLLFTVRGSIMTGKLHAPSGCFPGSASGVPLVATALTATSLNPFQTGIGAPSCNSLSLSIAVESFRSRLLASQGIQSRDILHLHQPNSLNTRANPSAIDVTDLQARQRGPIQAVNLPLPSLGAGLFVASFPWDQGPANDLLNVDVRVRERFTYAR